MPAYHNLTRENKSYTEVSQWEGRKEMKEISWYLLGVVIRTLQCGIPAQYAIFNFANECIRVLLEFDMYARYEFLDSRILSVMVDIMDCFQIFKDVWFLARAGKEAMAKA
jgi:hypothetical protein